eukprot:jgi/Mesen1/8179/ME000044S07453
MIGILLSSKFLSVPQAGGSAAADFGKFDPDVATWMLVDPGMYTLDGSECNKIGASFSAFRFESDRCHKFVGSCLGSQLEDFAQQTRAQDPLGVIQLKTTWL